MGCATWVLGQNHPICLYATYLPVSLLLHNPTFSCCCVLRSWSLLVIPGISSRDLTDRRNQKEMNVQRVRKTCLFFPSAFPARSWGLAVSFHHRSWLPHTGLLATALPDSGSSHLFLCPGGDDLATTAINSPREMPYPLPFLWFNSNHLIICEQSFYDTLFKSPTLSVPPISLQNPDWQNTYVFKT